MKTHLILFSIYLSSVPVCYAASFDCQKADTTVEETICNNGSISELDGILASTYKLVLGTAKNPDALRLEQRKWVSKVRNPCKDSEDCLTQAYESRIDELEYAWAERRMLLNRALSKNASIPTKPFEGEWTSCFVWKGDEICHSDFYVQEGQYICGEWEYGATNNRTYSGQMQAVAKSSTKAEIKFICGRPGSETSTECEDETNGGWEKGKGELSIVDNHLDGYEHFPLKKKDRERLISQPWVKECLAGANPSIKRDALQRTPYVKR